MKYSDYHSKAKFKGSAAFYIIIAACLLGVGGAAWFAAANIKNREIDKGTENPSSNYSAPLQSEITMPSEITPVEDVGQPVSSEPYSSRSEVTSSATETKKPETVAFSMPVEGAVIKGYNEKELQYSATYGDMRIHTGIDIACEDGTSVSAAASGKVTAVEENASYGTVITIDHGNGIMTKYSAIKNLKVKAGDKVSAGDIIGAVTSIPSECADQSHLHLEVLKNGHPASPLEVLGINLPS